MLSTSCRRLLVRHASSRLGKGCPELQPSMQQSATSVLPVMPVRCLSCRVGPINGRASLSGKSFSYESVVQEDCGCISATNIGIRKAPKPAAQQLLTKACGATISHVLGLHQKSEIRRPTKSLAVKLGGRKVVRSHHPIQKLWRTRTLFYNSVVGLQSVGQIRREPRSPGRPRGCAAAQFRHSMLGYDIWANGKEDGNYNDGVI